MGNFVAQVRNSRTCLSFAVVIAGFIAMKAVMHRFEKGVSTVSVTAPKTIAPELHADLEQFVMEHVHCSQQEFLKKLKERFSFLHSVEVTRLPKKRIFFSTDIQDPVFRINNNQLLLADAQLIPQSWYQKSAYERLPVITVPAMQDDYFFREKLFLLRELPKEILSGHEIVWHDKTDAFLIFDDLQNCAIRFNADVLPTEQLYELCKEIVTEAKSRSLRRVKKPIYWIADIRFQKQIILYGDKEGDFVWRDHHQTN